VARLVLAHDTIRSRCCIAMIDVFTGSNLRP
jgi:hypothetical protein